MTTATTKECRRCHKVLPITDFYIHNLARDGRRNICKHCYVEQNLFRKAGKEYPVKHHAKLTQEEKRQCYNEYMRKYRDANREKVREISRRSVARRRAAEEEKKKKKRLPNGQGPRHEYHARQWRERKDELKRRNIERQIGRKIEDKPVKPQPVIQQPRLCLQCKNWPCFDGIEMLESDFAREGCHGFKQRENKQ